MHLLVIEDERALCETIVRSLRRLAYSVDYCYDGEKALALLGVERYDLVLLDLNLPKKDGMTVLRALRQTDRETRVLILSARSEVEDKVQGLDAGANDYLTKPFNMGELLARLRVLTRKSNIQQGNILVCGNTSLNTGSFELSAPGGSYKLASKEYQTMLLLMRNPGVVLSSARFLENIWDVDSRAEENTVWTYISYLRRKLEVIDSDVQIRTMRGAGYILEVRG